MLNFAQTETVMERDEHFSTRGIIGAQMMSRSSRFGTDSANWRTNCFRLDDAFEMSSVIAGVGE